MKLSWPKQMRSFPVAFRSRPSHPDPVQSTRFGESFGEGAADRAEEQRTV